MAFLPPFWVAKWSLRFVLTVIADHFFLLAPPALAKPHGPRPFFQTLGASIHSPTTTLRNLSVCVPFRRIALWRHLPSGPPRRRDLFTR
jgi:hypothetical protein